MQLTENKAWELAVTSGLSLVNFLEQMLDDKELAVVIDGWLAWSQANIPPGNDDIAAAAISTLFNRYTAGCCQAGGQQLRAQERVVTVFREREEHSK